MAPRSSSSPPTVQLASVRRLSGGRTHLVPRVPEHGAVETLCGQTLGGGTYAAVASAADCANCIRRSKDVGRVSVAFFAQDQGSELLRLSLEQARARPGRSASGPAASGTSGRPKLTVVKPAPVPALQLAAPERMGELVTRGFKSAGTGVWRSPLGVIVRLSRADGSWQLAEVVFQGDVLATRVSGGIRLRAGDVEIEPQGSGFEVRIARGVRPGE